MGQLVEIASEVPGRLGCCHGPTQAWGQYAQWARKQMKQIRQPPITSFARNLTERALRNTIADCRLFSFYRRFCLQSDLVYINSSLV